MAKLCDGEQFLTMDETTTESYKRDFPCVVNGMIRFQKTGLVFTPEFMQEAERIKNFRMRKDDIWVLSFPKSGTTWTQEMVWLINNDCDFEGAKQSLHMRSQHIEFRSMFTDVVKKEENGREELEKLGGPKVTVASILNHLWPARAKDESIFWYSLRVLGLIISGRALNGFSLSMLTKKTLDIRIPDIIDNVRSPRLIKSHLPLHYLPERILDDTKVVYVARNPKDVIVSYFNHSKLFKYIDYKGDLPSFVNYFINDQVMFAPFFGHVLQAWVKRNHPNMLFLFFEDRKKDLRGEILKVADFLGKKLSEDQIQRLTEHLKFKNMKQNNAANNDIAHPTGLTFEKGKFMRKGRTGDWKNHFTPEQNQTIDEWIERGLQGTDLQFITDLDQQD